MARGNKKPIPSDSDNNSDSDDELPSYEQLMQENLKYAKSCTSQQKKQKMLQEKLDSSQEAYKTCLNNMRHLLISILNYLLKLSNLRLVQQQIHAQSMMSNL